MVSKSTKRKPSASLSLETLEARLAPAITATFDIPNDTFGNPQPEFAELKVVSDAADTISIGSDNGIVEIRDGNGDLVSINRTDGNVGVLANAVRILDVQGGPGNNVITIDVTSFPIGREDVEVRGGDGNDRITVEAPNGAVIKGEQGNDKLIGGSGPDVIDGGGGNDVLIGGAGNNRLQNTSLISDEGDNVIFGGPDNDLIFSGKGENVIFGGGGADQIFESKIDLVVTDIVEPKDPLLVGEGQDYVVRVGNLENVDGIDAVIDPVLVVTFSGAFENGGVFEIPIGDRFFHPITGEDTGHRILRRGQIIDAPEQFIRATATGTGRIDVELRSANADTDLNPTNNFSFELTEVIDGPNLAAEEMQILRNDRVTSRLVIGEGFTSKYTVRNVGTAVTDQVVWIDQIFLDVNNNGVVDFPDAGDVLLSNFPHTGALNVGDSYNEERPLTIPDTVAPGNYNLIFVTDRAADVALDTDRSNNVIVKPIEVVEKSDAPTSPSGEITAFNMDYVTQVGGRTVIVEASHPNENSLNSLFTDGFGKINIHNLRNNASRFVVPGEFLIHQNSNPNIDFASGAFSFQDIRSGGGATIFDATGAGSFSDTKVAASMSITNAGPTADPLLFSFDAPNASNPDIQFAVTQDILFNEPVNFTGLAGVGIQNADVTNEQTLTVNTAKNQKIRVGIDVTHPAVEGGAPANFFSSGFRQFVEHLVVVEKEVPTGWNVNFVFPGSGPNASQREIFEQHGEILQGNFVGFTRTEGQVLGNFDFDLFIDATPTANAAAGSSAVVRVKVFAVGFGSFILKDVVEVRFEGEKTADLLVAPGRDPSSGFLGAEIFESVPVEQEFTLNGGVGTEVPFVLLVGNPSTSQRTYTLKAAPNNNPNFTVRYFNGTTDVTNQITSSAGFQTIEVAPGQTSQSIEVVVVPNGSVVHLAQFEQIVQVFSDSTSEPADAVKLVVKAVREGDLLARTFSTPGEFVGEGVNVEAFAQQDLSRGDTVAYVVRVENDSTTTPTQFRLKSTPTQLQNRGITDIRFFDPSGQDVTEAIYSTGRLTKLLAPGEVEEFFVEISTSPSITAIDGDIESVGIRLLDGNTTDEFAFLIDAIFLNAEIKFPADLGVFSFFNLPTSDVPIGTELSFGYEVINVGNEPTSIASWTDTIVLDVNNNGQLDAFGDLFLATIRHDGQLTEFKSASESYDQNVSVIVPNVTPGTYKILLVTDVAQELTEDNNRINNVGLTGSTITIVNNSEVTPPTIENVESQRNAADGSVTLTGTIGGSEGDLVSVSVITSRGVVDQVQVVGNNPFTLNVPANQANEGVVTLQANDGLGGITNVTITLDGEPIQITIEANDENSFVRQEDSGPREVFAEAQIDLTVDNSVSQVQVTITATEGTLLPVVPPLTDPIEGVSTLTQTGSVNEILNLLQNVAFQPNPDFFGLANVLIQVNDVTDPSKSASVDVPITIENVNDAPTAEGVPTELILKVAEQFKAAFGAKFLDADGDTLAVSLELPNGEELVAPVEVNGEGRVEFANFDAPANGIVRVKADDGKGGVFLQDVRIITDAANVTLTEVNGKLTIVGDGNTNDVKIELGHQGEGTVRITSTDSTLNNELIAREYLGIHTLITNLAGGNDVLSILGNLGANTRVILNGGAGIDTLVSLGDHNHKLTRNQLLAQQTMTQVGFERANLVGGESNNRLDASGFLGSAILQGGGGNDLLIGTARNDLLDGGEGIDTLVHAAGNGNANVTDTRIVGRGNDRHESVENVVFVGGPGNNTFVFNGFTGSARVNGQAGVDTLVAVVTGDATLTDNSMTTTSGLNASLQGIENVRLLGDGGNNRFDASATTKQVVLIGNAGDDVLFGGSGNDVLSGGAGDDELRGNGGNDRLIGGPGNNLLDGGPGQDGVVIHGTSGNDDVRIVWLGPGQLRTIVNGRVQDQTYQNGETIFVFAGAGNDRVRMDDSVGTRWNAEFHGQAGDDTLIGGDGDDELWGGPGADVLDGRGGVNLLDGQLDADLSELFASGDLERLLGSEEGVRLLATILTRRGR